MSDSFLKHFQRTPRNEDGFIKSNLSQSQQLSDAYFRNGNDDFREAVLNFLPAPVPRIPAT